LGLLGGFLQTTVKPWQSAGIGHGFTVVCKKPPSKPKESSLL
jgi:hypothetical protein